MSRFRLSKEASEDLIAIYIQGHDRFGPLQTDRYQHELTAQYERMGAFPRLARLRLDYEPPVRVFAYKAHVIIYDEEPEGIVIQRVRHGHEDWRIDPRGGDERGEP